MKGCLLIALVILTASGVSGQDSLSQPPLWSYQLEGRINSLTLDNSTILVGYDGGVQSLSYSKRVNWIYKTSAAVTAIKANETILVATSDGYVRMLDRGGRLLWERQVPGYIGYDSAADFGHDMIVCGSMDGFTYMFDKDGVYKWKRLIGSYVKAVHILNDTILAVSDRQIYLLDFDGRVKRNYNIRGIIRAYDLSGDKSTVALDDEYLYQYNKTGGIVWNYNLNEQANNIDTGYNLTVGTRDGKVLKFTKYGRVAWSKNVSDSILAFKADKDYVLVGTLDGKVILLSPDGSVRWYYDVVGRPAAIETYDTNIVSGTTTGRIYYTKMPKKDLKTSFEISAVVVGIVCLALVMVWRNW
jgi:hypothetical protein